MKILAIMDSHRKYGTSYWIVNEIEKALKGPRDVEFEYLFLPDVKL